MSKSVYVLVVEDNWYAGQNMNDSLVRYDNSFWNKRFKKNWSHTKKIDKFSMVEMKTKYIFNCSGWWAGDNKKSCLSNSSYGRNIPANQKK